MSATDAIGWGLAAYFALGTITFGFAVAQPRVFLDVSPAYSRFLLTGLGGSLCIALGAFLARHALTSQGEAAFAITTKPGSPDYSPEDGYVLSQITGAVDKPLGFVLGVAALFLALYVTNFISEDVATRVLKNGASSGSKEKPRRNATQDEAGSKRRRSD